MARPVASGRSDTPDLSAAARSALPHPPRLPNNVANVVTSSHRPPALTATSPWTTDGAEAVGGAAPRLAARAAPSTGFSSDAEGGHACSPDLTPQAGDSLQAHPSSTQAPLLLPIAAPPSFSPALRCGDGGAAATDELRTPVRRRIRQAGQQLIDVGSPDGAAMPGDPENDTGCPDVEPVVDRTAAAADATSVMTESSVPPPPPPPTNVERLLQWDCDPLVPAVSAFRSLVLGYMGVRDKARAALINETWYDAACQWSAWSADFASFPALALSVPFEDATHGRGLVPFVDPERVFVGPASAGTSSPDDLAPVGPRPPLPPPAAAVAAAAPAAAGVQRRPGAGQAHHTQGRATGSGGSESELILSFSGLTAPAAGYHHARQTFGPARVFLRRDLGTPFRFESPVMYSMVLDAAIALQGWQQYHGFGSVCELARSSLAAAGLSSGGTRDYYQFASAHVFLRQPAVMTAGPIDVGVEGYDGLPLHLVIIALAARWHEVSPSFTNAPWLVSLGWWAAEQRDPATGLTPKFHKLYAVPLIVVAASAAARLTRVKYFWGTAQAAVAMLRRFHGPAMAKFDVRWRLRAAIANRAASTATMTEREWRMLRLDERRYGLPPVARAARRRELKRRGRFDHGHEQPQLLPRNREDDEADNTADADGQNVDNGNSTTVWMESSSDEFWSARGPIVEILSDRDPRVIFAVFHHLRVQYDKMRSALDDMLLREIGPYALLETEAAGRRIALLEVARRVHEEEPVAPVPSRQPGNL